VGFSPTPLGIRSFAAVFAAPGEVAAEAEVSHWVVVIDLPQARRLSLYPKKYVFRVFLTKTMNRECTPAIFQSLISS
jgi:hypothetical protein